MNILFVIQDLNVGGAQTFMLRLANRLSVEHNVYIYDLGRDVRDEELVQKMLFNRKVIVWKHEENPLGLKRWGNLVLNTLNGIFSKFGYTSFRKDYINRFAQKGLPYLVKKHKIDFINTHTIGADRYVYGHYKELGSRPWAISMHGCYESHLHGGYKSSPKDPIDYTFVKEAEAILNKTGRIVLAAEKNKEILSYVKGVESNKAGKIYYGFEPGNTVAYSRAELGLNDKDFVIGLVARGDYYKGWEISAQAIQTLVAKGYHQLKLIFIYSDNEYMEKLKAAYASDHVLFWGSKPAPIQYIPVFNLGILPTFFAGESLPNTVIEYLYAHKPVIASAIGDISFMIKDVKGEDAGFLLSVDSQFKPSAEQLATYIEKYLSDESLLSSHIQKAASAFVKFDMGTCADTYLKMYNHVIITRQPLSN